MRIVAEMIELYFVKLQFMVIVKNILYSFTNIQYLLSILYFVSVYLLLSFSLVYLFMSNLFQVSQVFFIFYFIYIYIYTLYIYIYIYTYIYIYILIINS